MCSVSSATSASGSSTPAARSSWPACSAVHAQVVGPEFELQAPRPQRAQRQRGRAASRQGELRAVANVSRERRDRVKSTRGREADAGRPGPARAARSTAARAAPSRGTIVPSTEAPGDAQRLEHAWRRSARRGRARSRHTSAGRSDRCPSRRRSPTRTVAATAPPTAASSVVFPQPGPADTNTTGTAVALSMTSISASRDTVPPGPLRRQQLRLQQLERRGGPLVVAAPPPRRRGLHRLVPRGFSRRSNAVATTPSRGLGRRHDHEGIPTARAPCARGLVLSGLHGELAHGRCPPHRRAGWRRSPHCSKSDPIP